MGCGMTDRCYGDIFSQNGEGILSEELYALSIVQGCGVLCCGNFTLDGLNQHDLEVMALPFTDQRALGGTVLVGVMKPFDCENSSFIDRRATYQTALDDMLLVPSPRLLSPDQLPARLQARLDEMELELRALDLVRVIEMNATGELLLETRMPSFNLETAIANIQETLN